MNTTNLDRYIERLSPTGLAAMLGSRSAKEEALDRQIVSEYAALKAEANALRAQLAEEKRHLLADEERRKLTGDALHAEAEANALREEVRRLREALDRFHVREHDVVDGRSTCDQSPCKESRIAVTPAKEQS